MNTGKLRVAAHHQSIGEFSFLTDAGRLVTKPIVKNLRNRAARTGGDNLGNRLSASIMGNQESKLRVASSKALKGAADVLDTDAAAKAAAIGIPLIATGAAAAGTAIYQNQKNRE